jgi:hypothetical protein
MVKDAAQHNLKIINPPSFEQGSDTLTPIYLDHPLLNRIALLSGHSEIDVLHLAEIDKEDIIALQKNDIRWFVLPKRQLFLEKKIKALLDQHLSRWSEDDRYLVWTIPASL